MVLVPIRNDNAYFGYGLQSVQGTAVAPTVFPRWLDGSTFEFDLKTEEIWEGDGSRHLSQLIKNQQSVKIKMSFNPRPIEAGFFEKAAMGAGADAVTAAILSTTTTTAITLNSSTTVTLTSVAGLTGSTVAMVLEPGTANEEVAIFSLPPTGSTLTLVASYNNGTGKFAKSHAMGVGIATATTHLLSDQPDGAYYTIEVCLGGLNGAAGPTLRVRDCKCEGLKVSGKSGSLITYETEWSGIATVSTGSPATVTLEAHAPFLYTQGVWTLNSSTTGDALNVEAFDIQRKNNLDPVQAEHLTFDAIIFGNMAADVAITVVFTNSNLIALTHFGGTSGTTDAQPIGAGSLLLVFTQADTFHVLQFNLPFLHYSKLGMPAPKKDGKHYTQQLSGVGTSNQGASAYLMQTTVQNGQTAAY